MTEPVVPEQPAPEPELDDFGDGRCLDCGDPFHLDDTGGYNPPCACGKCVGLCRSCCDAEEMRDDEYERPEESNGRSV
jgi:hypothetical protein